jgi:hypothetical protein
VSHYSQVVNHLATELAVNHLLLILLLVNRLDFFGFDLSSHSAMNFLELRICNCLRYSPARGESLSG